LLEVIAADALRYAGAQFDRFDRSHAGLAPYAVSLAARGHINAAIPLTRLFA
jgi:hypothetical protein